MSETISPNRASLDRAATAMFLTRLTAILPLLDEEITAASKFTLVFCITTQEKRRARWSKWARKSIMSTNMAGAFSLQLQLLFLAPIWSRSARVYLSEWLPEMTLTVIEPTTYKAYLARQRAAAGKTMSVVIDMPRDHGRIHRLSSASGKHQPLHRVNLII